MSFSGELSEKSRGIPWSSEWKMNVDASRNYVKCCVEVGLGGWFVTL